MYRRKFFLTPIALASLWASAQATAQSATTTGKKSTRIPLTFSKLKAGSRPLFRTVERLARGDLTVEVDLWLRLDIDSPPAGGIAINPTIRIFEDSQRGRRPLLNSDALEGKSDPNSNEVHITGTLSGVNREDALRPLTLEFGVKRAVYFNPVEQSGATVSTVQGKDSFIVVSTR